VIQSLDPVGSGPRLDPNFLLGRGPVIDAEQARLLGLRNGQVVQAVVDNSASAFSVIWPAGQRQGLPTALQAFPLPSQWRWAAGSSQEMLVMLMPGGHIMLRPIRPAAIATQAPPSAPGSASTDTVKPRSSTGPTTTQNPGAAAGASGPQTASAAFAAPAGGATLVPTPTWQPYTLGQAFAAAQGAASAGSSAEVARLLQQAPAWAGFMALLQGLMSEDASPENESADTDVPPPVRSRLADMLGALLPRMGALTPEAFRLAVGRSGLGTEAALWAGVIGLDQDLKVALRRLARSTPGGMGGGDGLAAALPRALDTLERSALDSLNAQMQGQVLLSLVIPFGDAGPVALRIARERAKPDQERPPFVVDVHSAHSGLGPLWLRTQVSDGQQVAMTMWAARADVADRARERSQDLRVSLHGSGLRLSALDIVHGTPDAVDAVFLAEGEGP
jgi:hypothetical protein